ncbi:MAG: hypothetical protein WCE72_19140, partial [Pseudolabrys sp.]
RLRIPKNPVISAPFRSSRPIGARYNVRNPPKKGESSHIIIEWRCLRALFERYFQIWAIPSP